MTGFLIKSSVCALVLLFAYHLFLEREKMHRFNRFFLLFALVFSFAIPFITIEMISETATPLPVMQPITFIPGNFTPAAEPTNYMAYILWTLYATGASFFGFRFLRNLITIVRKKNNAVAVKFRNANLALVKEPTLPHTFGSTIFINETDYNNRNIEEELYLHELTHVNQKHTLDILFIEMVKTVFWFNPIFAFYKKAIQLNHEFLADEKVLAANNNVPLYQKLLLSKANPQTISLASSLNYALTKKRLVMMTKTTSAATVLLKKFAVLPLLSALLFVICTKTVAHGKPEIMKKTSPEAIDRKRKVFASGVRSNKTSQKNTKPVDSIRTEKPKAYMADQNGVYNSVPENPQPQDGIAKFYADIINNFKIPADFKGTGNIIAQFIVEKNGTLSGIKILQDTFPGMGDEAIRVLKDTKWFPGKVNNVPVRISFILPIKIEQ